MATNGTWIYPGGLLAFLVLAGCTDSPNMNTDGSAPAAFNGAPAAGGPAAPAGGQPIQPGAWEATVSDGFKGDKLTFRVTADGARIQDVLFKGYWRCAGSTKIMNVGIVPGEFTISGGSFSEVKKEPYLAYTFEGRFTSATEAEGKFRTEFGTDCDTYPLQWTARRIGD